MASGGIEGLDKLMKKYDKLADQISGEAMERAVTNAIKLIQADAKNNCPVRYGELRNSIKAAIENQDGKVLGTAYTNKEYAIFVEMGTGPVGEANHNGVSPNVDLAYSQTGWIIPRDKIGAGDKVGYTEGQPAQPFMYPALKNNEERTNKNIANYLSREIRKVVQD